MNSITFALAVALFATVFTLGSADSFSGGKTLETYPQGFERREFPRAWMCCTGLASLDSIAESDQVLQAFANGENDQKQRIALSVASFTGVFGVGSGEYCRYAPEASPEKVLTSPAVTMQKGTVLQYFAKKAKDNSPASLIEAQRALKAAIDQEGGTVKAMAWWKMMIVETTPRNVVYVGVPHRPLLSGRV